MYPPVNLAISALDNGLAPVWRQAIISTNEGLLIGPWKQISVKFYKITTIFIQENALENNAGHFVSGLTSLPLKCQTILQYITVFQIIPSTDL